MAEIKYLNFVLPGVILLNGLVFFIISLYRTSKFYVLDMFGWKYHIIYAFISFILYMGVSTSILLFNTSCVDPCKQSERLRVSFMYGSIIALASVLVQSVAFIVLYRLIVKKDNACGLIGGGSRKKLFDATKKYKELAHRLADILPDQEFEPSRQVVKSQIEAQKAIIDNAKRTDKCSTEISSCDKLSFIVSILLSSFTSYFIVLSFNEAAYETYCKC